MTLACNTPSYRLPGLFGIGPAGRNRPPGRPSFWWIVLVAAALLSVPAFANEPSDDDFGEVFWEFQYRGVVKSIVESRYDGEAFFLSLSDLFMALQIRLNQDPAAGTASGFYVDPERTYAIDFAMGSARIDGRAISFDSTAFVAGPLGYYLQPDLIKDVFGLSVSLDERRLTLSVATDDILPVVASRIRRLEQSKGLRPSTRATEGPLLFNRRYPILDGAVIGYNIGATRATDVQNYHVDIRGGGMLLGGDFESSFAGSFGDTPLKTAAPMFRWRYAVPSQPLLTQINAGELTSSGLRGFTFRGLSLSNNPVEIQQFFGSYPLHGETGAHYEVELYLNNQLIDVAQADENGQYTLEVPISYGSTMITLKKYGPHGEFEEENRRFEVPFTFVPRRKVYYTLDAGRSVANGYDLAQATVAIGLTHAVTAKVGVDYVGRVPDSFGGNARNVHGTLSARLFNHYVLTAGAALHASYSVSVSAFYPSLVTWGVEFSKLGSHPVYNRSRNDHETRLNVSMPIRLARRPLYLRLTGFERKFGSGRFAFQVNPDISYQPGPLHVAGGYRWSAATLDRSILTSSSQIYNRIGWAVPRSSAVPGLFRGLQLSARSSYNVALGRMAEIDVNVARNLPGGIRVQVGGAHEFLTKDTSIRIDAVLNLSWLRSSSRVEATTSASPTVTQNLAGALSFNSARKSIHVAQHNWVGRAAATIRMFLDENGNNAYDSGETIIENGKVRFRESVSTKRKPNGLIEVAHLQAYQRYEVTVDQSSIRNPLWTPRFETFAFVADANTHKMIDVPFVVSGEISGTIFKVTGGSREVVPGLKLHIRSIDGSHTRVEPVFSDGSFYVMGIPPGDYLAWVDSTQQAILKTQSDPPFHRFTLNRSYVAASDGSSWDPRV